MSWDSVVGQRQVKDLLASTIRRNRLAHAYVFSGPQGVGKDAAAIELAKVLNCENRKGGTDACDACPGCVKCGLLQHPNLRLVFALPAGKGEKAGDAPMAKLSEEEVAAVQDQLGEGRRELARREDSDLWATPLLTGPVNVAGAWKRGWATLLRTAVKRSPGTWARAGWRRRS